MLEVRGVDSALVKILTSQSTNKRERIRQVRSKRCGMCTCQNLDQSVYKQERKDQAR